ncbi:SMG9-like protein [Leptotrombidium deliense]|uniref:SMG9-like protein n=1 Tax=Leptotrombidium deliense TaxID=299467 RepID=A0A443S1N3_9ACAR|nr:SMG9-like protein [Leptotrombidium deliense]
MEMRHRNEKSRRKDVDSRRSESPSDSSPKVRILKSLNPSVRVTSPQPVETSTVTIATSNPGSVSVIQSVVQSSQQPPASQQQIGNADETIEEMLENTPKVMKLLEVESWSFLEHPVVDYLFGENVSSGSGGFNVVSAVGLQSVGKSSTLNKIAASNVFKTHFDSEDDSILKHVTHGLNLHITKERLFLLDTQPLLSASILDEYLKSSLNMNNISSDISEPETYVYITSLQLVSFLLAICDYVIVVSDWSLDFHLIKLISTAIMMVGTAAHRAEIIWYSPKGFEGSYKKTVKTLESLLGSEIVTVVEAGDDLNLLSTVMKLPTRRHTNSAAASRSHSCEKSWLVSAQRFWETSIKKSTLYSDYARFMP